MAFRTQPSTSTLDWKRIVALSSTFTLHVAAVAVVAIPIAVPLSRVLPQVATTAIYEVKPAITLPQPPDPVPPPHVPRVHRTAVTAPPPAPAPTPSVISTTAPESLMSAPAGTGAPTSGPATGAAEAPAAGETRTLAYDGALRLRYPPGSMRQREQGTVLLRVLVDASGGVQRVEIEHSSGHPQLDTAAREAVQRAHFRPVLRDGLAVPAWGVVPIEFRLDRA
jgi:protein TonB